MEPSEQDRPRRRVSDRDDACRLGRARYGKRLRDVLGRADDEGFLLLIWAAEALQSDRVSVAGRYIRFPEEAANAAIGSCGLVLTLDDWLTASNDFQREVLRQAEAICFEKEPDIEEVDKLPIVFAPIHDFEMTLLQSTEEGLFGALSSASEDRFTGWSLLNVQQEVQTNAENQYPFQDRMGEVLPWWRALEELEAARS